MKLLLYCTKAKPYLLNQNIYEFYDSKYITSNLKQHKDCDYILNGKIIAECDFEVEEIEKFYCCGDIIQTKTMTYEALLGRSCLTDDEFKDYNPTKAIHIKNLHIFDVSRELSDYEDEWEYPLENAPQNMRRCYSTLYSNVEADMPIRTDSYILISIQPQWLCKILNGEKTIEVRKKVLKEMLK